MSAPIDTPEPEFGMRSKRSILDRLVMFLALWNGFTTCLVLVVALLCGKPVMRALLLMVAGTSLLWIFLGGALMIAVRDRLRDRVRRIPLDWRITFVLFCTLLALAEEAVTTTMTHCAPLFGVPYGKAYITASGNYLDVVFLHSVVVFVPMFAAWAWMLKRWSFRPEGVLLLFGITGILAEISFGGLQAVLMFGFWIFVYGLMIYLPAYCIPATLPTRRPNFAVCIFAVLFPILWSIPVAIIVSRLHPIKIHFADMTLDPPRPAVLQPKSPLTSHQNSTNPIHP